MPAKKGFNLLYPLVISIVINLGLIAAVIMTDSKVKEAQDIAAKAERQASDRKSAAMKLRSEITVLRELIEGEDKEVVPEVVRNRVMVDWKDLVRKIAEERGTESEREGRPEYTNLLEVYDEMKEELDWQSQEIARLKTQRDAATNDLQQERDSKEDLRQEKDSQIQDLQGQITREQNAHQEDNRKNSAEIQRLVDEKGELAQQREEMRHSFEIKIAELESLLSERDLRIAKLVKKQEKTLATAAPDGEILYADNLMRRAWIDLGRTHGLTRGLPFDVFQIQKGGRRKLKGRIEVLDVEDHLASVSIVQTADTRDPIVKGDFIISPLFDKSEQKVFVLLGEMVNVMYSHQEMVRKIEDAGSKVDEKVTVETDYVVAGKDAELLPEFQKALQLGIVVMREPELLRFLAP